MTRGNLLARNGEILLSRVLVRFVLGRVAAVGTPGLGDGIGDFSQVAVDFQSWSLVRFLRDRVRQLGRLGREIGHKDSSLQDYLNSRASFATNDSSSVHGDCFRHRRGSADQESTHR